MAGKWDNKPKPSVLKDAENKAAQHFAGEGIYIELPISEIRIDLTQPRTSLKKLGVTPEEIIAFSKKPEKEQAKILSDGSEKATKLQTIVDLAKSIQAQGNIYPITLIRDDAEKAKPYVIETGGRRFLALLYLGREIIRATYREDSHNSIRSRSRQIIENHHREDLSLSEVLTGLENLVEAYKKKHGTASLKISDFQEALGVNKSTAHRYTQLLDCHQVVLDAIHNHEITALRDVHRFRAFTTREQIDEYLAEKHAPQESDKPAKKAAAEKPKTTEKPINLGKTVRPDVITRIMEKVMRKADFQALTQDRDLDDPKQLAKAWKAFLAKLEEDEV